MYADLDLKIDYIFWYISDKQIYVHSCEWAHVDVNLMIW